MAFVDVNAGGLHREDSRNHCVISTFDVQGFPNAKEGHISDEILH
jgi:hypothetical protein